MSSLIQKRPVATAAAPEAIDWNADLLLAEPKVNIPKTEYERVQMEDLGRVRQALYSNFS